MLTIPTPAIYIWCVSLNRKDGPSAAAATVRKNREAQAVLQTQPAPIASPLASTSTTRRKEITPCARYDDRRETEPSIDQRTKVDLESAINRKSGVVEVPNAAVDSALTAGLAPTSAAKKQREGYQRRGLEGIGSGVKVQCL